ncbi:unnamed protein product, partial [Meganyctiphanes norvegica]
QVNKAKVDEFPNTLDNVIAKAIASEGLNVNNDKKIDNVEVLSDLPAENNIPHIDNGEETLVGSNLEFVPAPAMNPSQDTIVEEEIFPNEHNDTLLIAPNNDNTSEIDEDLISPVKNILLAPLPQDNRQQIDLITTAIEESVPREILNAPVSHKESNSESTILNGQAFNDQIQGQLEKQTILIKQQGNQQLVRDEQRNHQVFLDEITNTNVFEEEEARSLPGSVPTAPTGRRVNGHSVDTVTLSNNFRRKSRTRTSQNTSGQNTSGGGSSFDSDPDKDKIPGLGGSDYPIFTNIPQTSFACNARMAQSNMMFADPETRCQ